MVAHLVFHSPGFLVCFMPRPNNGKSNWDELDEDISVAGLLAGRGDATRSTKIAA
jgi:hypothetical protein